MEKKLWDVGAFKNVQASQQAFEALQKNEYIRYEDLPLRAKSGKLIDTVDAALFRAKHEGRSRVVVAGWKSEPGIS